MRILLVEYLSAGGLPGDRLSAEMALEGRAMLDAALTDLCAVRGASVATLLATGAALPVSRVQVDRVGPSEFLCCFRKRLDWADAVLVVAPETSSILTGLSEEVEQSGRLLLGSSTAGVRLAADKFLTAQLLGRRGVPTPPVAILSAHGRVPPTWRYPLVIKPRDGCGSADVHLVRRAEDLNPLVRSGTEWLIQPFLEGSHLSVSLLVAGDRAVPLSLNTQDILIRNGRFEYRGGCTGLQHSMRSRIFAVAKAAAVAVPGLLGHVGVDLVLTPGGPQVLDINPRLTTAYTGLRLGTSANLMALIINACRSGQLPIEPIDLQAIAFSKAGPLEGVAGW